MKLDRHRATFAKASPPGSHAWFYVNEGSITVVPGNGCLEVVITRKKLLAALAAMRKRSR